MDNAGKAARVTGRRTSADVIARETLLGSVEPGGNR